MSVKIEDAALGGYAIVEDLQGMRVLGQDGKELIKIQAMEQALQYVASRLMLDEEGTYTLSGYGERKREIFERIVAAQQAHSQQVLPFPGLTTVD